MPVIVRARAEADIARLAAAGASEVVPEAFESGLMLASHTLVWVGVPLNRVMRRVSQVRDEQYGLLRGLFHGASDEAESVEEAQPRLHAVTLAGNARAVGRTLAELGLEELGVQVGRCAGRGAGRRFRPARSACSKRATWWCCSACRRCSPRPKCACCRARNEKAGAVDDRAGLELRVKYRLQRAAERVDVGADFGVGPGRRRR